MLFAQEDLVCEIAKHLCAHNRIHKIALVSSQLAICIVKSQRYIASLRLDPNSIECLAMAAHYSHLLCLRERHAELKSKEMSDTVMEIVIAAGALDCVKYLRSIGYEWTYLTCLVIATEGKVHILKYAHENGCPWDKSTCVAAAEYGNLDCLKYAHENGCPWDEWTTIRAAESGNLMCLQYAHEHGCPWDERLGLYAWETGEMECVNYAYENGCPMSEAIIVFDPKKHETCSKCSETTFHCH